MDNIEEKLDFEKQYKMLLLERPKLVEQAFRLLRSPLPKDTKQFRDIYDDSVRQLSLALKELAEHPISGSAQRKYKDALRVSAGLSHIMDIFLIEVEAEENDSTDTPTVQ